MSVTEAAQCVVVSDCASQEIEAKLRAPAGSSSSNGNGSSSKAAAPATMSSGGWMDGQYRRSHQPDPMSWACDAAPAADPALADAGIVGKLLEAENNYTVRPRSSPLTCAPGARLRRIGSIRARHRATENGP
jgi:hypothetical protein